MRRIFIILAIANLIANITMFILIILPRDRTRQVRHLLAEGVMALWISTSRVWSLLHDDFWQKGNGH